MKSLSLTIMSSQLGLSGPQTSG